MNEHRERLVDRKELIPEITSVVEKLSRNLVERNELMHYIEFFISIIRYENLLNIKHSNNSLPWHEAVDYFKRKGLYAEFSGNPVLENKLKESLESGKDLSDGIEQIRERVLVNYFLEQLDAEADRLENDDERAGLFRKVLDDLTGQRLLSNHVDGVYIAPVYDSILESKIMLVSMRYYKIVGTRPR